MRRATPSTYFDSQTLQRKKILFREPEREEEEEGVELTWRVGGACACPAHHSPWSRSSETAADMRTAAPLKKETETKLRREPAPFNRWCFSTMHRRKQARAFSRRWASVLLLLLLAFLSVSRIEKMIGMTADQESGGSRPSKGRELKRKSGVGEGSPHQVGGPFKTHIRREIRALNEYPDFKSSAWSNPSKDIDDPPERPGRSSSSSSPLASPRSTRDDVGTLPTPSRPSLFHIPPNPSSPMPHSTIFSRKDSRHIRALNELPDFRSILWAGNAPLRPSRSTLGDAMIPLEKTTTGADSAAVFKSAGTFFPPPVDESEQSQFHQPKRKKTHQQGRRVLSQLLTVAPSYTPSAVQPVTAAVSGIGTWSGGSGSIAKIATRQLKALLERQQQRRQKEEEQPQQQQEPHRILVYEDQSVFFSPGTIEAFLTGGEEAMRLYSQANSQALEWSHSAVVRKVIAEITAVPACDWKKGITNLKAALLEITSRPPSLRAVLREEETVDPQEKKGAFALFDPQVDKELTAGLHPAAHAMAAALLFKPDKVDEVARNVAQLSSGDAASVELAVVLARIVSNLLENNESVDVVNRKLGELLTAERSSFHSLAYSEHSRKLSQLITAARSSTSFGAALSNPVVIEEPDRLCVKPYLMGSLFAVLKGISMSRDAPVLEVLLPFIDIAKLYRAACA